MSDKKIKLNKSWTYFNVVSRLLHTGNLRKGKYLHGNITKISGGQTLIYLRGGTIVGDLGSFQRCSSFDLIHKWLVAYLWIRLKIIIFTFPANLTSIGGYKIPLTTVLLLIIWRILLTRTCWGTVAFVICCWANFAFKESRNVWPGPRWFWFWEDSVMPGAKSSEWRREERGLMLGASFALSAAIKFGPTPPGP